MTPSPFRCGHHIWWLTFSVSSAGQRGAGSKLQRAITPQLTLNHDSCCCSIFNPLSLFFFLVVLNRLVGNSLDDDGAGVVALSLPTMMMFRPPLFPAINVFASEREHVLPPAGEHDHESETERAACYFHLFLR